MSWISDLIGSGAAGIDGDIGKMVDPLPIGDQDKAQLKLELEALLQKRDGLVEEALQSATDTKERLLIAELNQGDSYTKRARPTVVYAGLAFIFLNYCVVPGVQYLRGNPPLRCEQSECLIASGIQLPQEFWWAWGGIVGTWSIGRSFEKSGACNRLTRVITGSTDVTDKSVG